MRTIKQYLIVSLFGLVLATSVQANSIQIVVNNTQSTAETNQTIYLYPDFSQGMFARIIESPTCDYGSIYHPCSVQANSKPTYKINEYNGGDTTPICLSKTQPQGSFKICAPSACQVYVNFKTGQLEEHSPANCQNFHLSSQLATNGMPVITVS